MENPISICHCSDPSLQIHKWLKHFCLSRMNCCFQLFPRERVEKSQCLGPPYSWGRTLRAFTSESKKREDSSSKAEVVSSGESHFSYVFADMKKKREEIFPTLLPSAATHIRDISRQQQGQFYRHKFSPALHLLMWPGFFLEAHIFQPQ